MQMSQIHKEPLLDNPNEYARILVDLFAQPYLGRGYSFDANKKLIRPKMAENGRAAYDGEELVPSEEHDQIVQLLLELASVIQGQA